MDDFEKEYFNKLKQISSDYSGSRNKLAKSRIKMFAAALTRQLIDENEKFHLIVFAGNSGLYMSKLTELVYEIFGIDMPIKIILPIYRFKEINGNLEVNDNSNLAESVKGKFKDLPTKANILFVDDEIMSGLTVKASLDLIISEVPFLNSVRCVIISEHHFFEWHFNMPKVSINFFAYSRLIQGLNGNIGYFIPEELFSQLKSKFSDVESYNHAMAIVVGGALKRKDDKERPFFDFDIEQDLNIAGYEDIKISLMQELKDLIRHGIDLYKSGEIKFRF